MKRFIMAAIAGLLVAAPAAADHETASPVSAFEERFGFKSVFWCAETVERHAAELGRMAAAGGALPAIAFDSAGYCKARHFPTGDGAECDEAVYSLTQLDVLYPGFFEGEIAHDVMEACNFYRRG